MGNGTFDPFVPSSQTNGTPGLAPGANVPNGQTTMPDYSQFAYRIGYFQIGGEVGLDEQSELEKLLSRSLNPNEGVFIVERKDSISSVTGVYTAIIIYLEKRLNA